MKKINPRTRLFEVMSRLDKTFKPLNEDYNQLLDYFKTMWSTSEEVKQLILSNSYLVDKYGQYVNPAFDWDSLSEEELKQIWEEWAIDEKAATRMKNDPVVDKNRTLKEEKDKTFMLDGEELPVYFKFKQYDKNGSMAVELWDAEGPYATLSSNLAASSALPQDEFYLKHWGENERLAQELINKKIIIPTGEQEEEMGAQAYRIAPEYSQSSGLEEDKIPPQYQSETEHDGGEAVSEDDEFFKITTPVGSEDEALFVGIVNQGIDSHLEAFTKSKFDVRQGSMGSRRVFNFHKTELPLVLRRLRELGNEEADSWANDIESYDDNLSEMQGI